MMRAAEAPGIYKKFLGSSFLSDFTLIICGESAVGEQAPEQLEGPAPQHAAAADPQQQPGTPDAARTANTAVKAAAGLAIEPVPTATGSAAAAAVAVVPEAVPEAAADGPCSGQDHHGHAEIVPQSPHRAAASAGVGPLSAALLQSSASHSQQQQTTAEPTPGPTAAGQLSALRPILTAAAATGVHSSSIQGSTAGTTPRHAPAAAAAPAATHRSSSSGAAQPGGLSKTLSISSSQTIVMPVHGVVLAAASPYFETLLRGWACSQQPLHMVVGDDQLTAAQQLLAFMYTGNLQPHLAQADLLQLLLLSDRFDVSHALAAARRALASLTPECIEWGTLTGVWGLPAHLFEGGGDEAAALRGVAWERLLQLFGDLEEAWATADGRGMWQQLPWRAVSALAASDALAVASENTTFAAVSSWIAHQQHSEAQQQQQQQQQPPQSCIQCSRPTPQELQLLAASIRPPALGPCYLSYVCLQQQWFAGAVDVVSLARAAAFAAAGPEVRKDLTDYTATSTAAAMQAAAAAAAPSHEYSGSSAAYEHAAAAAAAAVGGPSSTGGALSGMGTSGLASCWGRCSSCGSTQHTPAAAAAAAGSNDVTCSCCGGGSSSGSGGSSAIEQRLQLLSLAQAMQRPRALSVRRAGQFSWRVDLSAVRQLYDDVAASGSRDSRILRSPAHSFAGYEWALQLEVTQTRGATGFDVTKPWSLGVFLTCQVRLEQPASSVTALTLAAAAGEAAGVHQAQDTSAASAATNPHSAAAAAGMAGSSPGDGSLLAASSRRLSSSSGSSAGGVGGSSGLPGSGSSEGGLKGVARSSSPQPQQQQQQLVMQLVDFGLVSTSATIGVREAGSSNKRLEKSWEHAVVRYRASWGWPNYLDAQALGWDEGLFGRWLIDGQLHLSARVRVLG